MKFPAGFLWGTASAAHQVEGNDVNCEWWEWENRKREGQQLPYEASGMATNFYHRYEEDFDLAKGLNNNVIRISLAWNRIEPVKGKFDRKEIEHYRKVLLAANKRGLKVFLTLQHFTLPLWFYSMGGWLNLKSPQIFAEFARKCAKEFDDRLMGNQDKGILPQAPFVTPQDFQGVGDSNEAMRAILADARKRAAEALGEWDADMENPLVRAELLLCRSQRRDPRQARGELFRRENDRPL